MTDEPTPPRIELFSRKRRNSPDRIHYWRIRAANSQVICSSQGYSRPSDRTATIAHLRGTLIEARLFDMDRGGEEVL